MRRKIARWLRGLADILEPKTLDVARGDALTALGIQLGFTRETDAQYRARLMDALRQVRP